MITVFGEGRGFRVLAAAAIHVPMGRWTSGDLHPLTDQ
jgi:hypothetical protein